MAGASKAQLSERLEELEAENTALKDRLLFHLGEHYEEMKASHAQIFELQEKEAMYKRIIRDQDRRLAELE
jgi:cell shape-determining protein MreC